MFSNKNLFTMEPEVYNDGSIDQEKLIINKIDTEFLSHIIFIPQFEFGTLECLDPNKLRGSVISEFRKKEVEMVIKFSDEIADGDIALQTDVLTML
jgi:hypothetical protein